MRKVRKPLPTSLRKAIITKNKNKSGNDGLAFIACSKAVKVYLRGTGYLGNAYFDGNGFYFSAQLWKSIIKLPLSQRGIIGSIIKFLNTTVISCGFGCAV